MELKGNLLVSGLTLKDATDITLGSTTGTKFGTATTQKFGFYNATPIVQPTGTTDLRQALINLGLYATGGATPLNLNGGTITANGSGLTNLPAASLTGTIGVTVGGTGTTTAFTLGSIVFAGTSGVYTQDNANLFWDNTNKRLGIGTATPNSNLQIYSNSTNATSFEVTNTSTGGHDYLFASCGSSNLAGLPVGMFSIYDLTVGGTIGARFNISSAGNIGIGTTTPGSKLEVKGTATSGVESIGTFSSGADYVGVTLNATKSTGQSNLFFAKNGINSFQFGSDFLANGTKDFFIYDSTRSKAVLYVNSSGDMKFGNDAYSGPPYMTILQSSGRVGIGTTSPGALLDVNGTVNATLFSGSGASLTSLNASNLTSGTVAIARLGSSGTPSASTYLRGDGAWATPAGGGGGSSTLAGLSDVSITSLARYNILQYNGTAWANTTTWTNGVPVSDPPTYTGTVNSVSGTLDNDYFYWYLIAEKDGVRSGISCYLYENSSNGTNGYQFTGLPTAPSGTTYKIVRQRDSTGDTNYIGTVSGTSFTDNGLADGVGYYGTSKPTTIQMGDDNSPSITTGDIVARNINLSTNNGNLSAYSLSLTGFFSLNSPAYFYGSLSAYSDFNQYKSYSGSSNTPGVLLQHQYSLSGSAGSVDLNISRYNYSLGSGEHLFLNLNVAGVYKFKIDTNGKTTLADGADFVFGTTTGTKIGTATTQKLSFYGSTPIVQPTSTTDLRQALINLGLYATGGATPLNLNSGLLTSGTLQVGQLSNAASYFGSARIATVRGTSGDTTVLMVSSPTNDNAVTIWAKDDGNYSVGPFGGNASSEAVTINGGTGTNNIYGTSNFYQGQTYANPTAAKRVVINITRNENAGVTGTPNLVQAFTAGGSLMTYLDYNGSLTIGNAVSSAVANPPFISMGTGYASNTPGNYNNVKLALYGYGTTNTYGMGISSSRMEYQVPNAAVHSFYINSVETVTIGSAAMTLYGGFIQQQGDTYNSIQLNNSANNKKWQFSQRPSSDSNANGFDFYHYDGSSWSTKLQLKTTGIVAMPAGKLTGGTSSATYTNYIDMAAPGLGFAAVDMVFPGGTSGGTGVFRTGQIGVLGTNDIFFQACPLTTAGYGYLEAFSAAGMVVGTGQATPVLIRPNRTTTATFASDGSLTITGKMVVGKSFVAGLVPLTDGTTIATDASAGNTFTVTLGASGRTFLAPTNPTNGQKITYVIAQGSTGSKTVVFTTGSAGSFAFGTDVATVNLASESANTLAYVGCIYNLASNRWHIVSLARGYPAV